MTTNSLREWVCSYTAATLLVVVATAHQYRTTVSELSWWGAGAGFGMYTTVDNHGTRTLRITVHTPKGAERVAVDTDAAWRARVLPSQATLDALAQELLHGPWTHATDPDGPRLSLAGADDGACIPVHRVEVELWRKAFDTKTASLTAWRSHRATAP